MALRLKRLWRRPLFHLLQSLARLARRLGGFEGLRPLGRAAGDFQYFAGGLRRRRYARDLAVVLGKPPGDAEVGAILRAAYRSGNLIVMEVLTFPHQPLSRDEVERFCDVGYETRLKEQLDTGRPVIILNNHMGNSMMMQFWLAMRGYPLSVVYRESGKYSPGFFRRLFSQQGIEGIAVDDGSRAYRQMLRALRRGRILCTIMDQGAKSPAGVPVRFLGKDMRMPAGPAQLARRAGAVIMPVTTLGCEPRWAFEIGEPVALDPRAPVEEGVRRLARLVENQILERPHLWMWHHRRWRRYPLATDSVHNLRE